MAILTGKLVRLAPPCPGEAELYHRWLNDRSLDGLSGAEPFRPCSLEEVRGFLRRWHRPDAAEHRWTIRALPQDEPIGQACLWEIDEAAGTGWVGLEIARPQDRGKGRGTEALDLICGYAFSELGLQRLRAEINRGNGPSIALFERLGFRAEPTAGGSRLAYTLSIGAFSDRR